MNTQEYTKKSRCLLISDRGSLNGGDDQDEVIILNQGEKLCLDLV